jgi:hypothetical protein
MLKSWACSAVVAVALAPDARERAVLIVGHGPISAEDYAAWMANLRVVADAVKARGGFRDVRWSSCATTRRDRRRESRQAARRPRRDADGLLRSSTPPAPRDGAVDRAEHVATATGHGPLILSSWYRATR